MRRSFITLVLLFIAFSSFGQAKITWQDGYKLSVLDFQTEAPETQKLQGQSYYLAANLDFSNAITSQEFRRTKNLNKLVIAYFIPAKSWLQQGEGTEILLKYAQMDFDLLELYARKYRRQLHEEKNIFSNPDFMQKAQEMVITNMGKRRVEMQNAIAESDGRGAAFHEQILKEIAALAEFCQECKPPQK